MSPVPIRFSNGLATSILGENFNALVPTVDNFVAARLFLGEPGMRLYIAGAVTPNDGGQGMFSWTVAPAVDNNDTALVVTTAFPAAYWLRISRDSPSASSYNQVTFESLGAPTTGAIFTGSISGTTLTTSTVQSGTIATGMTLTAAGGTGTVLAGTVITSGSGTSWQVNTSQTVSSTVMVANDSWPYVVAAQTLGNQPVIFTSNHYFSRSVLNNIAAVNWSGPNGRVDRGYVATLYFPSGYGGLFAGPPNMMLSAQGDVSYSGGIQIGGGQGSIFSRFRIQIGAGTRPAALTNNRPALGVYTPIATNFMTLKGADGDGVYIFGDTTHTISDISYFYDTTVTGVSGNGIESFGADASANRFFGLLTQDTGLSGVYEHGFLGNSYEGCLSQLTGQTATVVRRTNNLYYSIQDANLNQDPTSSSGWWQLWTASVGADTWNSGTTYNVGAVYRTSGGGNRSEFISCYSEPGYPPALFQASSGGTFLTTVIGGQHGAGIDTTNGGYAGTQNGVSRATAFTGFNTNGYTYDAAGNAASVSYRVWNTAALGYTTSAGYEAWMVDKAAARFAGKIVTLTNHPGAIISAWNLAGTEVPIQYWDGEAKETVPVLDNDKNDGSSTQRWKNNFSALYHPGAGTATWTSQAGTPEGSLTATGGSFVTDTATGLGYLKTTVGSGNTGYKQITIAGAYTAAPLTMTTARLLGRTTASTGAVEEISVTDGLSFTGGVLKVAPAAAQVDSTAVDVAGIVADFNSLLAKLRTAKLLTP